MRLSALAMPPLLATLVLAGCGETPSEVSHETLHGNVAAATAATAAAPSASESALAKSVHAVTSRFHATVQATKAGYAVASPCVAVPGLGAMGYHWVNSGLVDPTFDPLNPEAVLYIPNAHGNLKLVAVEYLVINVGQPAPTFAGHPFDVGGSPIPVPHWSLHLWVHEDNPAGLFTPFNPAISCP